MWSSGLSSEEKQLGKLCSRVCEGVASEEDCAELEQLMMTSKKARTFYLEYVELHRDLEETADESPQQILGGVSAERSWFWPVIIAAAFLAVLGAAVFWKAEVGGEETTSKETEAFSEVTRSEMPPEAVYNGEPLALIAEAEGVEWDVIAGEPELGRFVGAQPIHLAKGRLGLRFYNGTDLVVEAPAKFKILSGSQMMVVQGNYALRMPAHLRAFTVESEDCELYGRTGAAFGFNFGKGDAPQVFTRQGVVRAALVNDLDIALASQDVKTGEVAVVSDAMGRVVLVKERRTNFASPPSFQARPLRLPTKYREAVQASTPTLYWSGEDQKGDLFSSKGSEDLSLLATGGMKVRGDAQNHYFEFPLDQKEALLISDEIEGLGQDDYTLELFVHPASVGIGSVASFLEHQGQNWSDPDWYQKTPDGSDPKLNYLMHLEYTGKKRQVQNWVYHDGGRVRFLHRSPPDDFGGVNLFSQGEFLTPMRWYHMVAAREADQLVFYLNGVKNAVIEHREKTSDAAFNLLLGRLRPQHYKGYTLRRFWGAVDEIAVYRRALSAEEVTAHWQAAQK